MFVMCVGVWLKPTVNLPPFYFFIKQAESCFMSSMEDSKGNSFFMHNTIYTLIYCMYMKGCYWKMLGSIFFPELHYYRTFPENLETLSAFLLANKQMHLTLLCCLATQASPWFYIWKTSMLPIWRLTGCRVNETSHNAFLIKSLQAFSERKGLLGFSVIIIYAVGDGDMIDFCSAFTVSGDKDDSCGSSFKCNLRVGL